MHAAPLTAEHIARELAGHRRILAAVSGGLDSTVLLHLLHLAREGGLIETLRVVHVDHGLHPQAKQWSRHVAALCEQRGIPFLAREVVIGANGSVETAARKARYAALFDVCEGGEAIATAHHQDDQAETVLLRLMRGAGIAGIAAMRPQSRRQGYTLLRPLLPYARQQLMDYAEAHGLTWMDDPSNQDVTHDRNYLRRQVIPALRQRWPAATATLARFAAQANESESNLAEVVTAWLPEVGSDALPLEALRTVSSSLAVAIVRVWLQNHGVRPPGRDRLEEGVQQWLHSTADAEPRLHWNGHQCRRYDDRLYLLPSQLPRPPAGGIPWDGNHPMIIEGLGELDALRGDNPGLAINWPQGRSLTVCFRQGGERIRLPGRDHHHSLKHWMQAQRIPPWLRDRLPLLYLGDELIAVSDLVVAEGHEGSGEQAAKLRWRPA